jgi:hypothetical protein
VYEFSSLGAAGFAQPGQPRRLSLRECFREFGCGVAAGADAVGDADAAVGVSGECEARQLLAQALDAVEAIEMSDAVLSHGGLPSVDADKDGRCAEAEDLLQFVPHDFNNLIVGERPNVFRILSSEKAAQQGAIFGGAMREFIVHEGRSK